MNLTVREINDLGTFNAERGRGLMHTPEPVARMADLQQRFDQHYSEKWQQAADTSGPVIIVEPWRSGHAPAWWKFWA